MLLYHPAPLCQLARRGVFCAGEEELWTTYMRG
nr:MAG TPA: hypothetical protein [Caudoviricetes sp.]